VNDLRWGCLVAVLLGLLVIGATTEVVVASGDWSELGEGYSTGYYETPLGWGTVYNSAAVEMYKYYWWDGYGWLYSLKESAAGAARECDISCGPGMIVKQGVDLIKDGGSFSFMANPNDERVAAAFPYSGTAGLFEDIAQDIAEIVVGNLPHGVGYAYTAAEFAYNLKKGYDELNDPGNVYFRWTTYGSDVGHFAHWLIEIDSGSYADFTVKSKIYWDPWQAAVVSGSFEIRAPSYTPYSILKQVNIFSKMTQGMSYRTSGIAKYTINSNGTLHTLYVINPKYAEIYKKQFNIPDFIIYRAQKRGEPIYVAENPQVKVLKIESYIERGEPDET